MKKLFAILIAFAVVFAACDSGAGSTTGGPATPGSKDNSDVIGVWTGSGEETYYTWEVKLDITDSTWILLVTDSTGGMSTCNGTWTRNGNTLTLSWPSSYYKSTASLSEGKLILKHSWIDGVPETIELTKGGSSGVTGGTTLKINNQSFTEITDVVWQNFSFAAGQSNSIGIGSNVTKNVTDGSGYIYFKRKTNPINARTSELVVLGNGENKEFTFTDNTVIVDVDNPSRSGTLAALQPVSTTLKINNQSFTEITDVIWRNVSFANNQYENSIKSSTNVTKTVQAGSGYIFFKRKSNPITARTSELVVVGNGENKEFTFTDNTFIVEINNPDNDGTLGALQNTVVWWDDAEGEMQPYYERQSFVGYYLNEDGLLAFYDEFFYNPKSGRSIGIGGTTTALLHLKINLTKRAKLSFWYANRYAPYITGNAVFSINGVEKRSWSTDVNWSFIEFDLESGLNDLIWEKKDGRYNAYGYYLSLDDILIYYTE